MISATENFYELLKFYQVYLSPQLKEFFRLIDIFWIKMLSQTRVPINLCKLT